jgi:hypothetical protein
MALTDNLVAFWSCYDNAASTTVTDDHSTYDMAANTNTTNLSTTGKITLGFDLDGTNDYAQNGSFAGAGITQLITLGCWVKFDVNNTEQILMYCGDGVLSGGGRDQQELGVDGSGNPYIETARGSSGARATATGVTVATDGTWYHIVGVCRGTTDREIYVNNVSEGTNSGNEALSGTQSDVSLGAFPDGSSKLNGVICEAGLWSAGISTADLSTWYGSGSGLAYPFSVGGGLGIPLVMHHRKLMAGT